jgi:hypothetical protein
MSSPPVITSEQRNATIEKARAIRIEMADVRMRLASASLRLTEALTITNPDTAVGRLYVVKVLESLPGVGKVRARRVMIDIGISAKCRVVQLGSNQRAALLREFGK